MEQVPSLERQEQVLQQKAFALLLKWAKWRLSLSIIAKFELAFDPHFSQVTGTELTVIKELCNTAPFGTFGLRYGNSILIKAAKIWKAQVIWAKLVGHKHSENQQNSSFSFAWQNLKAGS